MKFYLIMFDQIGILLILFQCSYLNYVCEARKKASFLAKLMVAISQSTEHLIRPHFELEPLNKEFTKESNAVGMILEKKSVSRKNPSHLLNCQNIEINATQNSKDIVQFGHNSYSYGTNNQLQCQCSKHERTKDCIRQHQQQLEQKNFGIICLYALFIRFALFIY